MKKITFIAQSLPCATAYKMSFLSLFILSILTLPGCALLNHKNPTQKAIEIALNTVHTLDVYSENNTVHALFSGLDPDTRQLSLKYLNSSDSGKNWRPAVTVNQELFSVKKSKRGNDFQIAAFNNKVMAVWQTQGGQPWTGKIAVALSTDFGQTWQQIASPVGDEYAKVDQGYFDLTADKLGQFHIAWLDDREEAGDTQALRYARFSGQQDGLWEQHAVLEMTACTCCWTSITSDKNGNIHVLYRNDKPRDMMIRSSLDAGKSWQKAKTAGAFDWQFIGCPHQGGGLISTQTNKKTVLHSAIWNGKNSSRGIYYSQSALSKDKVAVLMPIGDNSSASADIAALDNDHLRIIYTSGDFESKSVMSKSSSDGGQTWSDEQRLSADGAEPSHPRIIATENGFQFFWTQWQENGDAIAIISELE